MQFVIQQAKHYVAKGLSERQMRWFMRCLFFITLCLLFKHGWAADPAGTDLAAGGAADLTATTKGTGTKFIYLAELIMATATYIKTKNLLVFVGIFVVAAFVTFVLTHFVAA